MSSYLVVCADVYHHGEALIRPDSRAGCVQAEFTNRNAHSESAEVSQSQNTLSVSHDYSLPQRDRKQVQIWKVPE